MFSGIVEEACPVVSFTLLDEVKRLCVRSSLDHSDTRSGDSIAINGVCLTVIKCESGELSFDIAEETLRRTSLGELTAGARVNLERSLQVGDRISGHFVFGHVDTTATLVSRESEGVNTILTWQIASEYMRYIATKGSVSISGVSLTVGETTRDTFRVYVIPHTFEKTNLAAITVGTRVNIEIDMLARYVDNALRHSAGETP